MERYVPLQQKLKLRHLFVECQEGATLCQLPLEITRDLRTLIVIKRYWSDHCPIVDDDQFERSVHLRVLDANCSERLPYSIVNLKHLCYLNWNHWSSLSINNGSCSPSHLDNMQTLYLDCEYDFVRLVSSLRDLANLRHLHLHSYYNEDEITCILPSIMPDADLTQRGICYSSTFSKLVEITLSDSNSRAEWLSLLPLSQMPSLRRLRVKSMDNIKRVGHENYCYCPLHLGGADIRESVITNTVGFPCLEELIFDYMLEWEEWSGVMDGDFPCLRKLTLKKCPSLSQIPMLPSSHKTLTLTDCPSLSQIPMLPSSLKTLHISGCSSFKSLLLNNEQVRFPYMEELVFDCMSDWEEWPGLNIGDFPCLRRLTIKRCNKLRRFPLLPSLLDIKYHGQQVGFPCLEEMVFENMPEWEEWSGVMDGDFPCLRKLIINRCYKLQGFPTLSSSSLKLLYIKSCWSLTSLAGLQNLTSLESLELERCPNLHISSQEEEGLPSKPQHVKIVDCPLLQEWCNMHQFNCIQESYGLAELTIYHSETITKDLGVHNLTSLKRLELRVQEDCLPSDGWLPPMIQILEVCSCNWLFSLSLVQNLLLLTRLEIRNCPFLRSVDGLHNLPNLEELSIASCPRLYQLISPDKCSLPSSLQSLSAIDCKELRSLPLLHEKLSSLEKLEVLNCPELTIMDGLHNLSSLKTLIIRQCPHLWLSSDEQLSSMPHFLSIADCPELDEWCQQQSIPYTQTSWLEEWRQQQSNPSYQWHDVALSPACLSQWHEQDIDTDTDEEIDD